MSKKDILKKSLESFRKHINSLSKEELDALKEKYNRETLLFNESQDATLGLVASIGFLILIFYS